MNHAICNYETDAQFEYTTYESGRLLAERLMTFKQMQK